MVINEKVKIIEHTVTKQQLHTLSYNSLYGHVEDFIVEFTTNMAVLGSGSFGTVYGKKKSKTVHKVTYVGGGWKWRHDPYFRYINDVVLPLQGKSSFVPKVYNVEVHVFKTWHARPQYQTCYIVSMEKLKEFDAIDDDVAIRVLKKYGFVANMNYCDYGLCEDHPVVELQEDPDGVLRRARNKCIKQTIPLLKPLFKKYDTDCYPRNFMWRKVDTTYQLVLTDPVYNDLR